LTALSSPKAAAKVFMVERVKDIVLKAAQLIDSSIYDLDENNTWTQIKVHWDRPDEAGRIPKRPTSIGQLLGTAKWEKPLADWIVATGVGLLGPGKQDYEEERIERTDGWRREPFV
jgi:hypothetical protein